MADPVHARLDDWRSRLDQLLLATSAEPYRPGRHDCILFAGSVRFALTGADPMDGWAGLYTSVEGGLELARAHGCSDPFAHVTAGLTEIPVALASVGDLAMLEGLDGLAAMGVVVGDMIATVGRRGREFAPLTAARRAWRV